MRGNIFATDGGDFAEWLRRLFERHW